MYNERIAEKEVLAGAFDATAPAFDITNTLFRNEEGFERAMVHVAITGAGGDTIKIKGYRAPEALVGLIDTWGLAGVLTQVHAAGVDISLWLEMELNGAPFGFKVTNNVDAALAANNNVNLTVFGIR